MFEQHTCPRRSEGPRAHDLDVDTWRPGRSMGGQNSPGLSCSYCGSLHPDRFLELARQGWWVGPTDKPYKAYLSQPFDDSRVLDLKREWMASPHAEAVRRRIGDEQAELATAYLEREWAETPAARGLGLVVAKFYFQHLSDGQRGEFIQMVNDRVMRLDYPGHFYVTPFFARVRVE